jgi:thiol-disulfide isomerase/thioredoxin
MNQLRRSFSGVAALTIFLLLASTVSSQNGSPSTTSGTGLSEYEREMLREQAAHPPLTLGSRAPDFNLPGIDGKMHSLNEYKDSPILVISFMSNHCPVSQVYEGRFEQLIHDYRPKGVAFIAIQPDATAAESLRELNYSDLDDSLESMVIHAKYRHFDFPYLYDGDRQEVVDKYGPKVTPHVFIFDKNRILRFEGRIDDNMQPALTKTQEARDALDALLGGREVAVPHTPVFGCSTKWKDQTTAKQREQQQFEALPVKLEMASADDLKKLRTNSTGKILMINFWATWCGPCVEEYHDLLMTYLWYRSRNFDLVSVSMDTPENKDTVLKFLQEQHSGVRNLQIASADVYAMQAAFDPKWDSGVPFTIVLAPDGRVIYREDGEIHLLNLRRAILANLPDLGFPGNAAYWAK